jgi:hypothetical protein
MTYRKKKENLVDDEYKDVVKEFKKGRFPGPTVVSKYKHPVENREVIVSKGQQRSLRKRYGK